MTATAAAPNPVAAGTKSKDGPNKILLIALALLAAVALFIYVINPMLSGSDDGPTTGATTTEESAPGGSAAETAEDVPVVPETGGEGATEQAPAAPAVPVAPPGVEDAPAATLTDDPVVDPAYAGTPRDPFLYEQANDE